MANSGNVSVTNSHGKVTNPMFNYVVIAKISGISPNSGQPVTSVTISGTDFGNTMAGINSFEECYVAILNLNNNGPYLGTQQVLEALALCQ